jgi:hypothetical protein
MPLTTGELDRIRTELGDNVLTVGAEPYIGVSALFSQVIAPYLREGLDTTSSTAVLSSPSGTAVPITLASVTDISLHSRLAVDVDDFLEMATVRAIAGSVVTVILKKAHAGTYTVTLDGGLQIIRECLSALYKTQLQIDDDEGTGAIRKVDEIEFYDSRKRSSLELLAAKQEHWRDRLRSALGIVRKPMNASRGGTVSFY